MPTQLARRRYPKRRPARRSRLRRFVAVAALLVLVPPIVVVLLLRWVDPPTSAFIVRERALAWIAARPVTIQRVWVDWESIASPAKLAVIASEDQRFPDHLGFDIHQIEASLDAARDGGRLRGASTITQQVAKNLFLWPGQDWVRKGLEAYFTVLIETFWPKRRILEVYLNVAEFGTGVFGVEAAAQTFYRKPASRLNAWESARLAAVLPSPKRLLVGKPSVYVTSRQAWILAQMQSLGGDAYLGTL